MNQLRKTAGAVKDYLITKQEKKHKQPEQLGFFEGLPAAMGGGVLGAGLALAIAASLHAGPGGLIGVPVTSRLGSILGRKAYASYVGKTLY